MLAVVWLIPASHSGHYWMAPAPGLCVEALAANRSMPARILARPGLVRAGEASYCLYLTHYLLRDPVDALGVWGAASGLRAALALAVIVFMLAAAAWLLHIGVERPARNLLRARPARRTLSGPAAR